MYLVESHPKPAQRLERLGRKSLRRKPEGGPKELTARHLLLITYLIDGCQKPDLCSRIVVKRREVIEGQSAIVERHPRPGEPLSVEEAADLLRIRRRNARELMTYPIFKRAYDDELKRFRDGEKVASLHRLVEVRDDPGAGKAADRKVQMHASLALLGEGMGSTNVTVNNNVGIGLQAGIVIDLRDDDEIERDARIIEHEDGETG